MKVNYRWWSAGDGHAHLYDEDSVYHTWACPRLCDGVIGGWTNKADYTDRKCFRCIVALKVLEAEA